MDRLLANLPAGIIAVGALALAILAIVIFDPPRTVCDEQLSIFKTAEAGFIFKSKKNKVEIKASFDDLADSCQFQAGPGGCSELFDRLRKLEKDLGGLGSRCERGAANAPEIKHALFKSLELFARLAWGERGPRSYMQKAGWLGSVEIQLFCQLESRALFAFGSEEMAKNRDRVLSDLPEIGSLTPRQVRDRSLYSVPCEGFR